MKKVLLIIGGGILSFIILLGLVGGGIAYAYRDTVYPRVSVGASSVASLNQSALTTAINYQVTAYKNRNVVVSVPDLTQPQKTDGTYPTTTVSGKAGQIGLQFNVDQASSAAWTVGHSNNLLTWVKSVATTLFKGTNVPLTYQVNPTDVNNFIQAEITPKLSTPVPATVQVSGSTVTIVDAKPGLTVDTSKLVTQFNQALPTAEDGDTIYLRAPVSIQDASITRATVTPLANELTALGAMNLSFKDNSNTLKPTPTQILSFFSVVQQDSSGQLTLAVNTSAITTYLRGVHSGTMNVTNSTTTVVGSLTTILTNYDTNPTVAATSVTMNENPVAPVQASYTLGLYSGKYIEVDLKQQRMFAIDGSTLDNTYGVSSGKAATPTPTGTFQIISKSLKAFSAEYGLYMPYWMNFTGTTDSGTVLQPGQFGIHELPIWPDGYQEGVGHIGTPVSDGCVRLDNGDAAQMYAWADVGTPVIIYE